MPGNRRLQVTGNNSLADGPQPMTHAHRSPALLPFARLRDRGVLPQPDQVIHLKMWRRPG